MKKLFFLLWSACIAHIVTAQSNVFNLPVQIVDGTQGIGKVLTSDASGLGSWQATNSWLMSGNNLSSAASIGSLNNYPLNIVANGVNRIMVGTNDTMKFKGVSIFDTLLVPVGYIQADSIRARVIHVGDSSITIGTLGFNGFNTFNGANVITMSPPAGLAAQLGFGSTVAPFDYVNIGIGSMKPVAMLQIGNDIDMTNPCGGGASHGWRQWMRFGALDYYNNVNMYCGLIGYADGDDDDVATDAAIAWGAEPTGVAGGPLNLRFIFTENCSDEPANDATGEWGREVGRITPEGLWGIGTAFFTPPTTIIQPATRLEVQDATGTQLRLTNTLFNGTSGILANFLTDEGGDLNIQTFANYIVSPPDYGGVGIIKLDYPLIHGLNNPHLALEVNGQVDIETVNQDNTQNDVLVWNATPGGDGNIRWRDASTFGIGIGFGPCAPGPLPVLPTTGPSGIDLNGEDLLFVGQDPVYDNVGIGHICDLIDDPYQIIAKLDVVQQASTAIPIAGNFHVTSTTSITGARLIFSGVVGNSDVMNNGTTMSKNIGGNFSASNAAIANYGVAGTTTGTGNANYGVEGIATGTGNANYGVEGIAGGTGSSNNYGGHFAAANGSTLNYGIYASALASGFGPANICTEIPTCPPQPPPPLSLSNYAGYFSGDVNITGLTLGASDSILKIGVQPINNSLSIINALAPRQYRFDTVTYSSMHLPSTLQFGYVAEQYINTVPNLIRWAIEPAQYDTSGTLIHDSVAYLSINTTELIPVLTGAVQQLDSVITSDTLTSNGISRTATGSLQWGGTTLLHNTVIPMVDSTGVDTSSREWNIYFTGQSQMVSGNPADIGIGYTSNTSLSAKLDVQNVNSTPGSYAYINQFAGRFYNTGTAATTDDDGGAQMVGVYGSSDVTGSTVNSGGSFVATNASGFNCGISGVASSTSGTVVNFGMYASTSGADTSSSDYAGYLDGDVYAATMYSPSDSKLKMAITNFGKQDAQSILNALTPKTYMFDRQSYPTMHLPAGQQYGLLAEDLEKIMPGLVKNSKAPPKLDATGKIIAPSINFKAVNYTALIPVLIAAEQHLDSTNQAQQTKIDALQQQLDKVNTTLQQVLDCCQGRSSITSPTGGGDTISVALSNNMAIILDQNDPNPFKEKTTINYVIPTEVQSAEIIFYDINGMVLKTVPITSRGAGSILVYASNLSSGVYVYALIADGTLIDSKRMVCQK